MNANKKSYFDHHPKVDKLHFTSDGFAFFDDHAAHNHAKHIGDRKVDTHTRAEANAWAEKQEGGEPTKKPQEPVKHVVTEEDLINNPEMAEQGLQVGDEVGLGDLVLPATKENLQTATKKTAKKAAEPKAETPKKTASKKAGNK